MYKPSIEVHELKKLFPYYNLLDLQIRMLKNGIQVILTENGIRLEDADQKELLKKRRSGVCIKKT